MTPPASGQMRPKHAYLQFILHSSNLSLLLLRVFPPVRAGSEYDIFAHRRGIARWTSSILLRETKLRPSFALSNSRVNDLLVYGESNASSCFNFLAIIVESPAHDRLGSVLVGCCG
jgi:hypothetical protein